MDRQQAQHIVGRFRALGWRSQARGSEFDQAEYVVDAENGDASEFYTCRRYYNALEVLAMLRSRASGAASSRADEIMGEFHGF